MLKKFFDQKSWVILLAAASLLALVIVASGLGDLHFLPGRPLARAESTGLQVSVEKIAAQIDSVPIWKQVVFLVLVFLLALIVISLFPREWRKKILKYFLRFLIYILAIFIFLKNFRRLFPQLDLSNLAGAGGGTPSGPNVAPAVFAPPQVPASLLYLISLGVIILIVGLVVLAGRRWQGRQRLQPETPDLENLAQAARASLVDISAGRNWQDAIIQCYLRMSEIVGTKRALQRRKDMTASEFAARLEKSGLPADAVRHLTHLFEAARYGDGHSSQHDIAEAAACLAQILQACEVSV